MANREVNDSVKSVEVTDELLSLLRAINVKLNSGDRILEDKALPASKGKEREGLESGNDKPSPSRFRWYENSLPGKHWLRKWSWIYPFVLVVSNFEFWIETYSMEYELPVIQTFYSDHNSVWRELTYLGNDLARRTYNLQHAVETYSYDYLPYEIPFKNATEIPNNERTLICESAGELWAIPKDGRIDFALTNSALYPRTDQRAQAKSSSEPDLAIVNHLKLFSDALQQFERCGFFVADLDPFNDRLRDYEVTGSIGERQFWGPECYRELSWDSRVSRVRAIP
jgi:hypothetical protein